MAWQGGLTNGIIPAAGLWLGASERSFAVCYLLCCFGARPGMMSSTGTWAASRRHASWFVLARPSAQLLWYLLHPTCCVLSCMYVLYITLT